MYCGAAVHCGFRDRRQPWRRGCWVGLSNRVGSWRDFFCLLNSHVFPGTVSRKYFVGLRVINVQESQAAGFATMFLREFIAKPLIMILSSVTLGIVNFWLVWDRDTQELWDKVVNTIVVSDPLGRTRRP